MKDSVAKRYVDFIKEFEGKCNFMYLDTADPVGYVTTGIGNLIDPISRALSLPWKRPDGSRATASEITSAWKTIKSRQDMRKGGGVAYKGLTNLRLDDDGIREVVNRTLLENEETLRRRFRSYDFWPADAQLAILSMAWIAGPNFKAPKFDSCANSLMPDFVGMAEECNFRTTNADGVKRNAAHRLLLTNAARTVEKGLDLEALFWPRDLTEDIKNGLIGAGKGMGVGVAVLGAAGLGYLAYMKWGV